MEDRFGSLEAGKHADLIVVGLGAPRLRPLFDPVSHLVYAAKGADVQHVVVEGRVVVEAGRVQTLPEAEILREADRWRARILDTLKAGAPR
jgi:5-methylthioadenosine/S-adenosylhomocysteine deaminase